MDKAFDPLRARCGHVEDADVNASFNIAVRRIGVPRSTIDGNVAEGCTDTPEEATAGTTQAARACAFV